MFYQRKDNNADIITLVSQSTQNTSTAVIKYLPPTKSTRLFANAATSLALLPALLPLVSATFVANI
jgi:hypothetical protein